MVILGQRWPISTTVTHGGIRSPREQDAGLRWPRRWTCKERRLVAVARRNPDLDSAPPNRCGASRALATYGDPRRTAQPHGGLWRHQRIHWSGQRRLGPLSERHAVLEPTQPDGWTAHG